MKSFEWDSVYKKYSKPILFVGIVVLFLGIFCYEQMQTNLFPEVMFPRVSVIASVGEQPIDRMMITTSKPLESAVKKVQGVNVVKSRTSRGNCTIDIYLNWGVDVYAAKTQIESRINEIRNFLPPGIVISTEAMNQSLFPVYGYTLESKVHSKMELHDVANLTIRPMFSQVKGISNVIVRGGKTKEFVIIPDVAKMSSLGITPQTIKKAFEQTNFVLGNGNIAGYHRLYLTLTDARINDVNELANTVIIGDGTRIVRLGDVAKVEVQEKEDFFKINADGHDAVLIDLVKQPGVNLVDFAKNVEAKAKDISKNLPTGYELKPYYNQSAFVSKSVQSVIYTICEGLLLALVVVVLFLQSWRASLVVMLTIPITLALSIILMYISGISIDIMSLGAIAASIGLIIDDAVVIIEQIYREHEDYPDENKFIVVGHAIRNLFPAMIASSLSTIVIYFPFHLMSGLAGSFFNELSKTMQITLAASFFVTWMLLPVLHLIVGYKHKPLPKDTNAHNQNGRKALKRISILTKTYRTPFAAGAIVCILLLGGWLSYSKIATGFLPDLDEGTIVLDYHSPAGTDLDETDRLCKEMEKIIMANKNIQTYSRRTGMAMGFETHSVNEGDYLIQLKNESKENTSQVTNELRASISSQVPIMTIDFGQRISDLLGDLMSTPKPIEIKIFGDDYSTLQKLASKTEKIISAVPGVVDIDNGLVPDGPSLLFIPNQERISQFGISQMDLQEQLSAYTEGVTLSQDASVKEPDPSQEAMTGGLQIGSIQDGEQMRKILLRFTTFNKNSPEELEKQLIFLPNGNTRPVSFFCHIKTLPGEVERKREDLKNNITLTARLENRDLGSTMKDLQNKIETKLNLPLGYHIEYGGAYSQQQQSFHELAMILCLAILLVLTVLMFLFRSWLLSLAILFISALGIGGCLLALWITGIPLNVSSYTGIIMVVGIIAENAIFTVNQYQMNRKAGGSVEESIDYAIALRIRPKLMTALGAIFALIPLSLGLEAGTQMQQPLAVAVIGGFCAALFLLLIVLPYMMRLIYHAKK
ncbi:MAG: efflux RND transporter permease subunit [Bacteroidales bacterium]|nr:efflux RND transporter permease subunit [Bacteroidales bacterium]